MRYIIAATALALVVGIALGFVVGGRTFEAEAKPPPDVQLVEEQNLDASGFVAVHEQGTANVAGTVDVGNLPAVQDVNVVSAPSQEPRLIELTFTNGFSQFVDTSGCSRVSILARGSQNVGLGLFASPDGTARMKMQFISQYLSHEADGYKTESATNIEVTVPFLQVEYQASNPSAWIWCQP